jgi:hypothetical protein
LATRQLDSRLLEFVALGLYEHRGLNSVVRIVSLSTPVGTMHTSSRMLMRLDDESLTLRTWRNVLKMLVDVA